MTATNEKSKTRTKSTGEIFTPPELVDEIVDKLYEANPDLFTDKEKMFLDPACGDGEFLQGVIRKFKKVRPTFTKKDWKYAIEYQLLGVDLMWDNVCDTVYYLLRSGTDKVLNPEVTTKHKEGHTITDHSTPEEINQAFESRTYKDDYGIIIIRPQKDSNHYVEYVELKPNEQLNSKSKWIKVENIVRANSLTEWDFENWQPIMTPISVKDSDILIY